jgi:hypothetical protein
VKTSRILAGISLTATVAMLAAAPAWTQASSQTVARYTIDAGTTSGMAAMGAGGGGLLGALGGGGNQVAHELYLRLGSTRAPTGQAKGDHFMPSGARLGQSVPLETQRSVSAPRGEPGPAQGQMPEGRLLLFWGCGERAGPGQPVVIDFSKLARGEVPQGLYANYSNLPEAWSVNSGNSRTYGEWPNSRDGKRVEANASLLGAHRIASTYAPEIAFNLAEDFMPALRPATRDMASGAVNLSWNGLDKATGYYAWVMATNPEGNSRDMVWWTSSSKQAFGGPMSEWISPAAARQLVADGTVMPPSQTQCAIPREVKAAGGPMMMTQLYAYGPQADFSYPERPARAAASWQPEWIARVRFRANAMVIHGMPGMGGFGGGEEAAGDQPAQPELPRCRGLSGIAKRAAGLCQ